MTQAEIGTAAALGRDRHRSPRAVLFAAIVAAHLAAILALLAPGAPDDVPIVDDRLSVFDIAVPPPPPPLPPQAVVVPASAGGSSARPRERPAPPVETDRVSRSRQFETTITVDAPSLPTSGLAIDTAAIDLGSGSGSGSGEGTDGRDTGSGRGAGSDDGGEFARYGRARWIVRPRDADFYRVWPTRLIDGKPVRQIGWAYLACRVRPAGQPYDCRALLERPAAIGMGAAAIDVVSRSRVRPVFRNGAALRDLPVLIPVIFEGRPAKSLSISAEASAPRAR